MEALRGSSPASSVVKPFSRYPNSSSYLKKWSTFGDSAGVSVFFLKLPSFRLRAASGTRRLRISSRLVRQARRQNILRESLLARQDQVHKALERTAPHLPPGNAEPGLYLPTQSEPIEDSCFGDDATILPGDSPSTLHQHVEQDVQTEDDTQRMGLCKESVQWNTLEGWVEQYKKDSEVWGIGSVPIFTIYKDTKGNVIRVSLNEQEIIRRSRVETWPAHTKELVDGSMDLKAKISCAKLMAKQIESGEYKLPKSSTIAKVIVDGSNSSSFSMGRILSLDFEGRMLLKRSPKLVLGVFLGCSIFLALKKVLSNGRTEFTREEKEMLRRKMKVRQERRTIEKGSIEVLNKIPELPSRTAASPPLDRNELMKNIKAKASKEGYAKSSFDDEKFEARVREIRKMVKEVHELEQDQQQMSEKGSEQAKKGIAKSELVAISSDVSIEKHTIANGADYSISLDNDVVEVSTETKEFSGEIEDTATDPPSNTHVETRNMFPKDVSESEMLGYSLMRKVGIVNETNAKVSSCDSNAENGFRSSDLAMIMNEGVAVDSGISQPEEEMQLDPASSGNMSYEHNKFSQKKPKIILSVEEAREYLNQRCASAKELMMLSNPESSSNSISERIKVVERPKDNSAVHKLSSHMVNDNVPNATDGWSINHHPWTAAATSTSSVDVKTGEVRCQYDMSLRFADDKILGKEAIAWPEQAFGEEKEAIPKGINGAKNVYKPYSCNHEDDGCLNQQSEIRNSELCGGVGDITPREPIQTKIVINEKEPSSVSTSNVTYAERKLKEDNGDSNSDSVSRLEPISTSTSEFRASTDTEMKRGNNDAGCEADERLNLRPSATCNKTSVEGDSVETELGTSLSESDIEKVLESNGCDGNNEMNYVEGGNGWVERNFHQFDPIIKKIGDGFQENFMVAKEKAQQQKSLSSKMGDLLLEDEELEWMNDENLRDIVFKVRDNELAGREPFYMMDDNEQSAFFQGLERKAEIQSKRLVALHELIHTKIENIDYGMDGISLNDPLEKIVPRWKGPPISEDPEFLNNFASDKQMLFMTKEESSHAATDNSDDILQKYDETSHSDAPSPSLAIHNLNMPSAGSASANPKTVIEGSDGSRRAGKKMGKEHWEHTKKWSREFLELYNAETDPEIKSIMKDMGKDLDKWITEKEVQDVADLMTRIPKRKRRYIEKKLDKLKREIETFGHQAVVSKYKEYSEEKDDYLWWLDLKFVLCIELYRTEGNVPKVGFYSLEMAADLELNPKQYHVIAFEDPGDSKNFCYIIQAHLELLGNGSAFVVARPPKDAFREAKANGFNVTVIRKGELKLNIDLTLEEVEEEIVEIGSKMYHDKIMRERSIDMGALMKGVFNADKSTKRKSKHLLKKSTMR